MILLGAGASKTFGIKTLQEMTDELTQFMEKRGHSDIIQGIIESQRRFGLTSDFESIYTIIQAMSNPIIGIKNSGPLTAYLCKKEVDLRENNDFQELLKEFNKFIYDECNLQNGFNASIQSAYDKFFQVLLPWRPKLYDVRYTPDSLNNPVGVGIDETIVTPNYDMLIELYYRSKRITFADGFSQTGDPFIKELDMSTYTKNKQSPWLIKLHGSIWMYKYNKGIFKTIDNPNKSSIPVNMEEAMMIFPVKEKPILEYPYYGFYNLFKNQFWVRLISIGYSFRDEPINITVFENLERSDESHLIIIDPNPDQIVNNIKKYVTPKINNKIIVIKGTLEDTNTFKKLELALQHPSRRVYNNRLPDIGIIEKPIDIP